MLNLLLIFNLIFVLVVGSGEDDSVDGSLGDNLERVLKKNENLDLPVDEEYEDLRAEFLAYRGALDKILPQTNRRSMMSTPCWSIGGICIHQKLCIGHRFLTQIPGCKDRHQVCCFVWNRYHVKDFKDKDINNLNFPWTLKKDFGGQGVGAILPKPMTKRGKKRKHYQTLAKID